jgi:NAD-dependent SIR2 family protein deacetylase
MSSTGEKPGVGFYICRKCGQSLYLNDKTDRLPPCPKCQGTEYAPSNSFSESANTRCNVRLLTEAGKLASVSKTPLSEGDYNDSIS